MSLSSCQDSISNIVVSATNRSGRKTKPRPYSLAAAGWQGTPSTTLVSRHTAMLCMGFPYLGQDRPGHPAYGTAARVAWECGGVGWLRSDRLQLGVLLHVLQDALVRLETPRAEVAWDSMTAGCASGVPQPCIWTKQL